MVNEHVFSTHMYNSLLINVSVSLIVSGGITAHDNSTCSCGDVPIP